LHIHFPKEIADITQQKYLSVAVEVFLLGISPEINLISRRKGTPDKKIATKDCRRSRNLNSEARI